MRGGHAVNARVACPPVACGEVAAPFKERLWQQKKPGLPAPRPELVALCASRGGAVHMVLEGSGHDSFNDAVQLVAVHYPRAVAYLRSFKPVMTGPHP